MSKPLKPKRGTTAENNAYIGEAYEITLDTDKHTLVVHDGATPGGFPLATEADLTSSKVTQATRDAEQDGAIKNLEDRLDFVDSEAVHKTGDETIAGAKTFTSNPLVNKNDPSLYLNHTNITKGVVPKSEEYAGVNVKDVDGNNLAALMYTVAVNGNMRLGLRLYDFVEGKNTYKQLSLMYNASTGTYSSHTITPSGDSKGDEIVNAEWVLGKGVLVESWHEGTEWYRKYSDDWIEQGGEIYVTSQNTAHIVPLNVQMQSGDYNIELSGERGYGATFDDTVLNWKNPETASFEIWAYDSGNNFSISSVRWKICGY